ncbi:hypothetical protein [Ruegeria arenilitoris]|uniref:hypothetical protein n=1 Tax=Ruegeria arenilitoris TaxID=1173585 RepID=UPI001479A6E0|nr:hypothetical protein [Ruegeria arenilitoris]
MFEKPFDPRANERKTYFLLGALILLAVFHFTYQAVFFTFERRPDEIKAIAYFVNLLSLQGDARLGHVWVEETWTRLVLFSLNIAITLGLLALKLIDKKAAVLVAIWPLSVLLFSKVYWEFFYFPLCLIRPDLTVRREFGVIALLATLLYATGEANLGVILTFRAALLMQHLGFKRSTPIGIFGFGVVLDAAMKTGVAFSLPWIGGLLQRFDWTRNTVNPDYSPIESIAVFVASFHFFSLHTGAYWIDALFSLVVVAYLMSSGEFRLNLRKHFWLIACFVSVFFFYTNVTYAFQNARYYFFFIPVLAMLTPARMFPGLAILGVLHVIFRSLEFFS